ncbi:MAG: T9SS type A sorting domain-containing protein [Flavobacteriaceae bacterium]
MMIGVFYRGQCFWIETKGNIQIENIKINNLLGQVFDVKVQNQAVDVSELTTGLYFITITTIEGGGVKKFIKK